MRRTVVWVVMLAACVFGRATHAATLAIATAEYDSWPLAVAMLENDVNSSGRVVHVVVTGPDGARVPCDAYALAFDEVAAQAFVMGACDPASQATEVRLVHREALFESGDPVPVPRLAGLTAREVLTATARGGAGRSAGSEVRCSVAIRPYLRDLEHDTRVYLSPGRFAIRALGANVFARAQNGGWTLDEAATAPHVGSLRVRYEVIDTTSDETLLRETASLSCARVPIGGDSADPPEVATDRPSDVAVPSPSAMTPGPTESAVPNDPGVTIDGGNVSVHGTRVQIRGGSLVIRGGGSLVIEHGGSLTIGE